MSTSTTRTSKLLGQRYTAREARGLLADWANVPADYFLRRESGSNPDPNVIKRVDAGIKRLMAHYPEIFSAVSEATSPPPDAESQITTRQWRLAAEIQNYLRRAWDASDLRVRQWFIFKARETYHKETVVNPILFRRLRDTDNQVAELTYYSDEVEAVRHGPPRFTEFEQAMDLFHRVAAQAKRCPNPDCPAPFFFASRTNQRYCSEKCAAVGQRDQKRNWWRMNRGK